MVVVVVVVEVKIDVNSFPRASLVEIVEIIRESSLEQDLDWRMSISFSLSLTLCVITNRG